MCYIMKEINEKKIDFEINLSTNNYTTKDIIDDLFNFVEIRSDKFFGTFDIKYKNVCENKVTYDSMFNISHRGVDVNSIQKTTHYYTKNIIIEKHKRRIISLSDSVQIIKLFELKKSLGRL